MSGCKIKIEREDGSGVRRITLNGERQKIIMATFLINQLISGFSTADKNEPKIEPVKPVVSAGNVVPGNGEEAVSQENMNSLAPGQYIFAIYVLTPWRISDSFILPKTIFDK